MTVRFFMGPIGASRLRVGPLGVHIDAFAADLRAKGYSWSSAYNHLRAVAGMSRWLEQRGLGAADLTASRVAGFVRLWREDHPPRGEAKALRDLIAQLRSGGVLPAVEPVPDDPIGRVTHAFSEFLLHERRLSKRSLSNYVPVVRRFLCERFGDGVVSFDAISPRDVTAFEFRTARAAPASAKLMVTALRAFFRFLRLRGHVTTDLAACVLPVAQWRLASVPQALPPDQVRRVLDGCDRRCPRGRRDYAILLLLARLGLRAGEVVAMRLEDIRWQAGEIRVRGKGSRLDRLPLPPDVGAAVAAYLRRGRPRSTAREVFLRMYAPHRGFVSGSTLWEVVASAIDRAGLHPPRKGAHVLRHSLATQMLASGASLAEIGEVLRHRLLKTTQIYAKVDLEALRDLARPWPGGGR